MILQQAKAAGEVEVKEWQNYRMRTLWPFAYRCSRTFRISCREGTRIRLLRLPGTCSDDAVVLKPGAPTGPSPLRVCPRRVATTDPGGCSPCSYRKQCPADRFYSSYRSGPVTEITGFTLGYSKCTQKDAESFIDSFGKMVYARCFRYIPVFERLLRGGYQRKRSHPAKTKAVVFIHAPRTSRFGYRDANLAYQNASLMAECLGSKPVLYRICLLGHRAG